MITVPAPRTPRAPRAGTCTVAWSHDILGYARKLATAAALTTAPPTFMEPIGGTVPDGLTDEQRRARALTIDQANQKIKDEYGEALAALGMLPVVKRVWPYTVEDHVEHARRRGIKIDPDAQHIQREYLDLIRSASTAELSLLVAVLTKLLDFDRLKSSDHHRFINEIIGILSSAEVRLEVRQEREAE